MHSFCGWLSSLSIMSSGFIHDVACVILCYGYILAIYIYIYNVYKYISGSVFCHFIQTFFFRWTCAFCCNIHHYMCYIRLDCPVFFEAVFPDHQFQDWLSACTIFCLFIHWWTFRPFQLFGYCKWCCYDYRLFSQMSWPHCWLIILTR